MLAGKSTLDNDGTSDEPGMGGIGTLFINNEKVGKARIEKPIPGRFGMDIGPPVSNTDRPPRLNLHE